MHVGSGMSFILTIVVSTTKNIAESKERRVSAEVLVIGSYAAPDHRVAPRVWGDVLSLASQYVFRCQLDVISQNRSNAEARWQESRVLDMRSSVCPYSRHIDP